MITPIPPLSRTSPTFKAEVNTLYGTTLPNFSNELNAEFARISTLEFGAYTATSTTSLAVTVAFKALTVETGKGFVAGQPVQIARTTAPSTTYMIGIVDSYNSGTGALVVAVSEIEGIGTFTDWTISVTSVKTVTAPYVNEYRNREFITSTQSFVVPDGVTSLRAYGVGAGGNGATNTAGGNTAGGGGGGFAYGDFDVTPGATVSITIASGDATVVYSAITMLSALNGGNASGGTAGTGGTATKDAAVTNGGAFSGGNGGSGGRGGGGGSSGSPLGVGFSGGDESAGGGGIGGAGVTGTNFGGGGGGAGGSGAQGSNVPGSFGGGSGSAASDGVAGGSRSFNARFTDPLLAHADGSGGVKLSLPFGTERNSPASAPGPGGGGAGAKAPVNSIPAIAQAGGDFGGGGGAVTGVTASCQGGTGGFLGGGGGAYNQTSGQSANAGNGGFGGGGGGTTSNGGGSATAGTGGAACVVIYY